MMKKILFILLCFVLLSGCATYKDTTFEEWVNDIPNSLEDELTSVKEILGYIEIGDVRVGLSLMNTKDDEFDTIMYLSQIFSNYGYDENIIFYKENDKRIWTMYDNEPFYYKTEKTKKYQYAYGILDGEVKNIKYEDEKIEQKTMNFEYQNEDVSLTLWGVELDKNIKFDYDKLTY